MAKSAGHVTQTTAPGAQAVWQRVDKNAPILSLRCVHVEPSQWDQIIPCDAFNLRFRKTKVSLRQWWICVILLPPFKAGSHTQRNTYESCKPHRIQWKNELWCYGNPKQQLLLPLLLQEWMWVNLIQSGRETGVQCWSMSKTSIQSSKRASAVWILSEFHLGGWHVRSAEWVWDTRTGALTWAGFQVPTWISPLACLDTRRGCWRSASSAWLSLRSENKHRVDTWEFVVLHR